MSANGQPPALEDATSSRPKPPRVTDLRLLPALEQFTRPEHVRWVLWRYEWVKKPDREGKWTKVPYQLDGRRKAANNRPGEWSRYEEVWERYQKGGCDGVGMMLLGLKGFVAVDLDKVREPVRGSLLPWAEKLSEGGTYCEVTPSMEGLRVLGEWTGGKVHRNGPHPDGGRVELFSDCERYITFTGLANGTADLWNGIDREIEGLLALLPKANGAIEPAATGTSNPIEIQSLSLFARELIIKGTCNGEKIKQRGPEFMRVARELHGRGYTFSAALELLAHYPGGVQAKYGGRLKNALSRAWQKLEQASAESTEASDRGLPEILLRPNHRADVIDQIEAALLAADCGLYCHGSRLVEISWQTISVADGEKDRSLRIAPITDLGLVEKLSRAAVFKRWSKMDSLWIECDPPREIAQTYLDRAKKQIPKLLGVITAPTLRYDGTVLQTPGYDEKTGIYFEPNQVEFPLIPDRPTKQQSQDALKQLKSILREYKFEGAGRSVALSAIITGTIRSALPAAPGHGFDAPVAGSGKTKLYNTASVIATGHKPAAIAAVSGRNVQEELGKQLAASVLAGDQMILLDNLDTVIDLPLLCQILTEQKVAIRPFGKLENVVVACISSVGATGNNLAVQGDNMRRWLIGRITVDVERPELVTFDFDPVEEASKRRPELVTAAVTIVHAYRCAGEKVKLRHQTLGSFERWSQWVREALVWLGEDDPTESMEEIRAADPAVAKRRRLMETWPFTGEAAVADVVARANEKTARKEKDADGKEIEILGFRDLALHTAVLAVASDKEGDISHDRLGWWLRHNKDQVVNIDGRGRCRFVQAGDKKRSGLPWKLECLDDPPTI